MTQDLLPTACSVCHSADKKGYRCLSEWAARHYHLNYDDEQLKGASMCLGKASICTPCRKKVPKETNKGETGRKTVAKKVDKLVEESACGPEAEFECGRCHGSFESSEFRDWHASFSTAIGIDETFRECCTGCVKEARAAYRVVERGRKGESVMSTKRTRSYGPREYLNEIKEMARQMSELSAYVEDESKQRRVFEKQLGFTNASKLVCQLGPKAKDIRCLPSPSIATHPPSSG